MNDVAIGLQKMEKNLATKELKQIWNSAVDVVVAVATLLQQSWNNDTEDFERDT